MAKGKKVLNWLIGLLLSGGAAYGAYRFYSFKKTVAQINATIDGASNLDFDGSNVVFQLKVNVDNPTKNSLTVNKIYGNVVQKDKQLSSFATTGQQVSIQAGTTSKFPVTVKVPVLRLTSMLTSSITNLLSGNKQSFFGTAPVIVNGIVQIGNTEIPFSQQLSFKS